MTFVFKRALALLALLLSLGVAMAAGPPVGPSPPPSPWTINGNSISYGGCVLVPVSVTGGCLGSGAINASAIYVNGVAVGSPSLVVGSTPVTGGVSGRILYDNAGKIGELATTGAGTVVLSTSPTLVSPVLGTPTSATLTNATGLVLTAGAGVTGILPTANGGTGLGTFTANLPLIGNGTGNLAQGTLSGNTTKFATVSGALTSGHCLQADSNGNTVDAGGACTTGGGGGTVSAGTANQIAIYATSGTAVSGMTVANNAVVVTNGSGVPSESTTLPNVALGTPTSVTLTNGTGLPNAGLVNSTISGVALGSNLASLTPGTHLTGGAYNGSGAIALATDATNANTASTIVARDGSGNFSAGTITASLTGGASLDLPLAGGTLSGNLLLGTHNITGIGNLSAATASFSGSLISDGFFYELQNATTFPSNSNPGLALGWNFSSGIGGNAEVDFWNTFASSLPVSAFDWWQLTGASSDNRLMSLDGVGNLSVFGKVKTTASSTTQAGLSLPQGAAPTSPVNGDLWATSAGIFARIAGATVGPFAASSGGGNVTGPGSSSVGNLPTFNNTVGTILADSGIPVSQMANLTVADQTLSGGANVTSFSLGTASGGTTTVDCGKSPQQFLTNGGAFTFAAPANDGNCIVLLTNNGSAGAVAFSGFTEGSNVGDALDTTNTHKFSLAVYRINSVSHYLVSAYQ